MKSSNFDYRYPSIEDLRKKASARIPGFAFDYLDGGCNEDVNLHKNTRELREVELLPFYLRGFPKPDLSTELFGTHYSAPFGISPIGLQGLIWPNSPEILAKAAFDHNVPFVLSTVTTSSIERIADITEGRAWFQLYNPADEILRDDILERLKLSGYEVLVLLCDVPSFGFRPRDIRNGLSMPPRMTLNNILQVLGKPSWALQTLKHGVPKFATMERYMPANLNMKQLGAYMNATFSGRLTEDSVRRIRDKWKGKIVLKGVATVEDALSAINWGLDGIIVSNHGGRQLDAAQSSILSMEPIIQSCKGQIRIMMDSGIRSGPDIARAMASGAEFTFLGRSMMYSVAALGDRGGDHIMCLLKRQLMQVMDQLCCSQTDKFILHKVHH